MANRVLVSVEDGMPEPVWLSQAESFLLKSLESAGYDGEELSVMFCSDSCIRQIRKSRIKKITFLADMKDQDDQ